MFFCEKSGTRVLYLLDRSKTKKNHRELGVEISSSPERYDEIVEVWKPYCDKNEKVRIYSSVDERNVETGKKLFYHMLIDKDFNSAEKLYAKALMQVEARATKYLHFDLDWDELPDRYRVSECYERNMISFNTELITLGASPLLVRMTPKGAHIITERFDWRSLDVEPKKNSLLYVYGE